MVVLLMVRMMSLEEMDVAIGTKQQQIINDATLHKAITNGSIDLTVIATVRVFFDGTPAKVISNYVKVRNQDKIAKTKKEDDAPLTISDEGTLEL
jgi:hypothetical protein